TTISSLVMRCERDELPSSIKSTTPIATSVRAIRTGRKSFRNEGMSSLGSPRRCDFDETQRMNTRTQTRRPQDDAGPLVPGPTSAHRRIVGERRTIRPPCGTEIDATRPDLARPQERARSKRVERAISGAVEHAHSLRIEKNGHENSSPRRDGRTSGILPRVSRPTFEEGVSMSRRASRLVVLLPLLFAPTPALAQAVLHGRLIAEDAAGDAVPLTA